MKIGFFEITQEEEINFFKQSLPDHELIFSDKTITPEEMPEDKSFDLISVFVASKLDVNTINAFPNLKGIFVRATGFDNIDLPTTNQRNIVVCNVPAYGSHTVAEFAFGLILNLTRRINEAINRVKQEKRFSFENLRGQDLFGKTLGVVGTGKIGGNVIKIAKGFEMNVLAFDAFPNQDLANTLQFTYTSLEEILKSSDIITIHVPYNKDTHHLLNSNNIPLIRQNALLINTSRGAVVETAALFQALLEKKLAGVALDVLEEEGELKEEIELLSKNAIPEEKYKTLLEEQVLLGVPSFILTPHMAFYTKEAEESIRKTTSDNIHSVISGNPQNQVPQ